jgi:hypothetical protein
LASNCDAAVNLCGYITVEHRTARSHSWCKRRRRLVDGRALEPGLLLFACFVVRQLAVNAANDSAAGSTAAVSSTSG